MTTLGRAGGPSGSCGADADWGGSDGGEAPPQAGVSAQATISINQTHNGNRAGVNNIEAIL